MSFDQLIASLGLGDLLADQSFVAQISMTSLSAVLFLASMVLCLLAFRAAGTARRSKIDAVAALKSTHETALEVRRLAAEAERSSLTAQEHSEYVAERNQSEPISDNETIDLSTDDQTGSDHEASSTTGRSSLLGGILRRR